VRGEFLSTGNLTRDIVAKTALEKIARGIGNFKQGKNSGRISNTILEVPRDARKNILHKDGFALAEYDLRTAHPFFLIEFCKDAAEREAFGALISDKNTDIYAYIGNEMCFNFAVRVAVGESGPENRRSTSTRRKRGFLSLSNRFLPFVAIPIAVGSK
jgi:hypothetical protein